MRKNRVATRWDATRWMEPQRLIPVPVSRWPAPRVVLHLVEVLLLASALVEPAGGHLAIFVHLLQLGQYGHRVLLAGLPQHLQLRQHFVRDFGDHDELLDDVVHGQDAALAQRGADAGEVDLLQRVADLFFGRRVRAADLPPEGLELLVHGVPLPEVVAHGPAELPLVVVERLPEPLQHDLSPASAGWPSRCSRNCPRRRLARAAGWPRTR